MSSHTLLVVDDSRTIRTQLKRILTGAGYRVEEADDGQRALELIPQIEPSLIILDVQMPQMDGYSVCQQLQKLPDPWCQLPVIFLTSIDSYALDLLGHALGDYLRKPIDGPTLLAAVDRFVAPYSSSTAVS